MSIFKKVLLNVMPGSTYLKVRSQFHEAYGVTANEIAKRNFKDSPNEILPFSNMILLWLCNKPIEFWLDCFVEENQWNKPLRAVFYKAKNANGKQCWDISQANSLWYLNQKMKQKSPEYKENSFDDVRRYIQDNLSNSKMVFYHLNKFEEIDDGTEINFEDRAIYYIEAILNSIFHPQDEEIKNMNVLFGNVLDFCMPMAMINKAIFWEANIH
jgi:hypothetical protein